MLVPIVCRNRNLLPQIFRPLAFPFTRFLPAVFVKRRDAVPGSAFFIFRIITGEGRIIDGTAIPVAGICENCFLFLQPLLMLVNPAHCQNDMCVRITITFIMQRPVRDHSFAYKIVLNIRSYTGNLITTFHFYGERHFDFPGKLCIGSLLDFLHFIPQRFAIRITIRCILRQEDLIHHNSAFPCEVVSNTGFIIV